MQSQLDVAVGTVFGARGRDREREAWSTASVVVVVAQTCASLVDYMSVFVLPWLQHSRVMPAVCHW